MRKERCLYCLDTGCDYCMTEQEKNEQARKRVDAVKISPERRIIDEHCNINEFMIGIPPEKPKQDKEAP